VHKFPEKEEEEKIVLSVASNWLATINIRSSARRLRHRQRCFRRHRLHHLSPAPLHRRLHSRRVHGVFPVSREMKNCKNKPNKHRTKERSSKHATG